MPAFAGSSNVRPAECKPKYPAIQRN